ncbi:MAG: hypothetical protein IID16_13445 [Candidatus Marinimicrobia bacterium]|nr:hypothetical protein [Candidatus Neomarinimicrobiota bacterium]
MEYNNQTPSQLYNNETTKQHKTKTTNKTLELLDLLCDPVVNIDDVETKVSNNYAVLEYNFEKTLDDEIEDYDSLVREAKETLGPIGKPLEHRFIANKLKKKVEAGDNPENVLPSTIIDIIEKIKRLLYSGSILRSLND